MTISEFKPVTSQEIVNIYQSLELLRGQIRLDHIDKEYVGRQLDKITHLFQRLEAEKKEQSNRTRFETLYNVSRLLGVSLDLQTVLNQVMDAVIKLTGAERGFLMLRDDDGNLNVQAARNLDQQTLSSEEFEYSRSIARHVLDSGKAVLTTDAKEDPRFRSFKSVVSQSLRSIMATPLRARGRIIGITYVENRELTSLFGEDDLATLETLSSQAAMAIDNALLFSETDEALSQRVDELRELRLIDMRLNEMLDPDKAMLYTLETACCLSDATHGHLGLFREHPERVEAIHHYAQGRAYQSDQPVSLDNVFAQVWQVIETGQTVAFDSGQYDLHSVLILPVIRESKTIGVVLLKRQDGGTFSDAHQDFVERVVARAAVTIENALLYRKLQAADKAKSEFVGIVAHELKAPMTSIGGYADLLLMDSTNLSEKQQRFLQHISNTVKRMEMLVSDLADISRIESGQFLMDEIRVSVRSVVEAVRDTVVPQIKQRQHEFNNEIETNLPDMYVDYYRLVQVLTNLLSNAYKYTPDGGTIGLQVWHADDRIHFSVSDTGIGITKENLAKLGSKFWRAQDDYTLSQPGSGLGFSITASLVEQMGSAIQIESVEGAGSTFSFSVQVYEVTEADG